MVDFTDPIGNEFNQEILMAAEGKTKGPTYSEIMKSAKSLVGDGGNITSVIELNGKRVPDDHGKLMNGVPLAAGVIFMDMERVLA